MYKRSYGKIGIKRNRRVVRFRFFILILLLTSLCVLGFKFIEEKTNINQSAAMENSSREKVDYSSPLLVPKVEHKDIWKMLKTEILY